MNHGRITSREWEEFEVNFRSAWNRVKDATAEEARRMIIQNYQLLFRVGLLRRKDVRVENCHKVKMNVPEKTSDESVSLSIENRIGKRRSKVSKINEEEYEICLPDFATCEKLQGFAGLKFTHGGKLKGWRTA
ncbi:hypothetical protein G9P55_28655, partial [Klebsiella pneumoniae]|uniref:hypothetical protein n=1 Tax=Klebsiella pneumoniae TaxID=573 RepID=UPI00148F318B